MRIAFVLTAIAAALLFAAPALAADWVVTKLRGSVQQLVDEAWVDLARGDVVPNDRMIRTLADGHVDLERGLEALTLGINTQITIHDQIATGYTTVTQDSGSVEVEAEVQNVQHFAVETQFLAAVVKGTHFIVTADDSGSRVKVTRGRVAVQSMSSGRNTTVGVGQEAEVALATDLVVAGIGELPEVLEPDGSVLRPAFTLEASSLGTGQPNPALPGGRSSSTGNGETQTAMLVNPGNARSAVDLAGVAAGNAALVAADGSVTATPADVPPVNGITILVGLLIGAAVGAVALLFRRSVG